LAGAVLLRVAAFALAHLGASFLLMTLMTPWRESLESWVWRLRGRLTPAWDLWLGERSQNGLALVTFSLLGVISLVTAVIVPFGWQEGFAVVRDKQELLVSVVTVMVVLTLSLGTLYEWLVAMAGRTGTGLFLTLLLLLVVPCHVVGYNYEIEWLLALTPSAHFASWFSSSRPPSALPLLALYGVILALSFLAVRRRVIRLERSVDRKLEHMGVIAHQRRPATRSSV